MRKSSHCIEREMKMWYYESDKSEVIKLIGKYTGENLGRSERVKKKHTPCCSYQWREMFKNTP